jgi:hypothetical protein
MSIAVKARDWRARPTDRSRRQDKSGDVRSVDLVRKYLSVHRILQPAELAREVLSWLLDPKGI